MKTDLQRMIAEIESEVKYTRSYIGKDKLDPRVMEAMSKVSRDEFVPPDLKRLAYDNGPLPIGHGQTISQPYIVALMTDMLQLEPENIVLEIGSGSGYQSAVLSLLCKEVHTVEIVTELGKEVATRLKSLGYNNIKTHIGNGYDGWPEHAPYDAIIVTAAATHIPEPLIEQLRPGGRMAIPLGLPRMHQELMLVVKNDQGEINVNSILGVAFVPLVDERTANKDHSPLH